MQRSIRLGMPLAVAALLALAGAFPPSSAGASERVARATVSELNGQLSSGYAIAPGDKLRVTVFDEPTLTGEYTIGVGGELALPLIETIHAGGQSTAALTTAIADKLQQGGYVLVPRVSVEIIQHRPFFILGEVKLPGEYPYSGDLTLDQAVAKAGGYTPRANKGTIVIRRQDAKQGYRVRLDGTALKIAPGDTIIVQEAFF